jgi:Rrf2 family protein
MRISYKGDYALKAMLDLAVYYSVRLVSSHDMAKRIDAPIKFLEQVLLDLRKGGFIESKRGNVGGYLLSKAPDKITVGEVIRYIDGPIEPIACLKEKYSNCIDINSCVFNKLWHKVHQATADIVDNVTFEGLVSEVNSNSRVLAYSI